MRKTVRSAWLAAVTLALVSLACGACGSVPFPAPVPLPPHAPPVATPAPFKVGTWRVDLTPPPGVTTFGHGPDSLVAEGYWTRIYCRVFVVESGAGERIAIVPCDLSATSKLLHRTIAEKVKDLLPATRIFVSSTHTHAGPAHYMDGQGYDGAESTHMPGFDPNMVEFMATAVGDGIRKATARERWATMSSWHYERDETCAAPGGDCGTWGLTWNRSPKAHVLDGRGIPKNAPKDLCPVEQMIDPSLHVVRFDEVDAAGQPGAPIGEIVAFAMHPTVLPNTNRLIGADSAGALSRVLERRLRVEARRFASTLPGPRDPLAAVLNTNEGDMSPTWKEGTKAEAVKFATEVARRVKALTATPVSPQRSVAIDARYAEADLADQRTSAHARTCETAEVGLAGAYGACDHPTTDTSGIPFTLPPDDGACQSPKLTPAGPVQRWLAGGDGSFPLSVPLSVLKLGENVIAYVPVELTIEAGRAVDDAVKLGLRSPPSRTHVWVGGLTNGDILYAATPAEYAFHGPGGACYYQSDTTDRQSYEAGTTLYGPQTVPRLASVLGDLARSLDDEAEAKWLHDLHELDTAGGSYTAWPTVSRLPLDAPGDPDRHPMGVCRIDDRTVCFAWADAPPGGTAVKRAPWVYLADPGNAGIGACDPTSPDCDPSEIIDDRGTSFVTRARRMIGDGEMMWATLWRRTDEETAGWGAKQAAFYVRDRAGAKPVVSTRFTATHLPPLCTPDEAAVCGTFEETPHTPSPLPGDCR